ncbi:biosynthetic-type acetolactate synthase large subunit [Variovorax sp. E3]|uniref:biosynthetic-type acetolactate synthase large subunit n=1 Tax=Variovorax sp. E3 TaxID=1914993 RepID=UPI0018DB5398|nr:biosynthetic-type acetolactate synthase large subunit [Variovorax sp. E3]
MQISPAGHPPAAAALPAGTFLPPPASLCETPEAQALTGSEVLVRCLQAEDVAYVWGYPGGAVLHVYDALHRQRTVQHVLVRHEQSAVHAADGYARATGKVGVVLVTSGPGLTNAVTGIATAYMDSIPLVVISGQVSTEAIGQDAFQECDTVGITRPIVKHSFLVKDPREIARTLKKAFHIARSGRPGPVVVDFPIDVSRTEVAYTGYPDTVPMRAPSQPPEADDQREQIRQALTLLMAAERPCVFAGGGVVMGNAARELRTLVDLLGCPVTTTLMGLGAYPASDPKFLGMPGMHGTWEANNAMQHCDVLLAIGARFDDRVIGNVAHFARSQRKIIHVDIDPSSIAKRVKVDLPIVGDVGQVLTALVALLGESVLRRPDPREMAAWWRSIATWRARDSLRYDRYNTDVIKPQRVIETLCEMTRGDDVYITSDVGQHQMWTAQYFGFDAPRRWINSGGFGTMGVGIPYAIGVKMGRPDSEVFCITGDGSVQMSTKELSTCLQYDAPIQIVLLNNRYLGMVRQQQLIGYDGRYSHSYLDALPDFVKLAEAYGHVGMRVERPADVGPALREARGHRDRTVLIDFRIDPTENVFPTVKDGQGMTEMLLGSEDL